MVGAPVADEDVTIRLVTAQQWKDGRPTSAVFKGNWPLSVWVQSRLSTLDGLRRGSFADCGFVGLLASTIRGIPESEEAKLDIVYAPEGATQEFEDLAGAHAHITSLLGGQLRSGLRGRIAKRLAREAITEPGAPVLVPPRLDEKQTRLANCSL